MSEIVEYEYSALDVGKDLFVAHVMTSDKLFTDEALDFEAVERLASRCIALGELFISAATSDGYLDPPEPPWDAPDDHEFAEGLDRVFQEQEEEGVPLDLYGNPVGNGLFD